MSRSGSLSFPPYRLDLESQRLWRGLDEITLKPKTIAILLHLATHPRKLISKEELLRAVWGETTVSSDTVRSTLRELRRALGDDAAAPQFIETVHGRGYRFIGQLGVPIEDGAAPDATTSGITRLVGRDSALHQLNEWFAEAVGGDRRTVFVHGEPGIGKTSIVEAFVAARQDAGDAVCCHGQCMGGYGDSESYLPLLEAIERLCRQAGGGRWIEILERHAPTWLIELPGLLEPEKMARVRSHALRVDRDRMLRELAVAIEAITAEQPLVLLLEDLHWSDAATLQAIDMLSRRSEMGRLLLLATHRPAASSDPRGQAARLAELRVELGLHDLCRDLPVDLLSAADTSAYLEHRFPGADATQVLSQFVHRRSEGNPLLMVSHADALLRERRLVETSDGWQLEGDVQALDMPSGVRQAIEYQIDQLSDDAQRALERVSVAGVSVPTEWLTGVDAPLADTFEHVTRVAREHGLVRADGELHRFVHALHQEVLYERIPPAHKRTLHRELGLHLEAVSGGDTAGVAALLAMHFERGADVERAIRYLGETADLAIQRCTNEAAEELLRHAMQLLDELPMDIDRSPREFSLLAKLGHCLTLTKGYVDPEVRDVYGRAFALSEKIDADTPELIAVLAGLCGFNALRGYHERAGRISQQLVDVAEQQGDAYDRMGALLSHSITRFSVGRYQEAAQLVRASRDLYDPRTDGPALKPAVTDPGVQGLGHGSLILAAGGNVGEAMQWSAESVELAREHDHVPSQVLSYFYKQMLNQLLQDVEAAEVSARECLELSMANGFPYYAPGALIASGWVQARKGEAEKGALQASQGLALLEAAGAVMGQPLWCAMVAEAQGLAGEVEAGLETVAKGLRLIEETGEIASEPALHWMHGELLLKAGAAAVNDPTDPRDCFRLSIERARRCGAPTQGLGAAISLARLSLTEGPPSADGEPLDALLRAFSPTDDAPILREARALASSA